MLTTFVPVDVLAIMGGTVSGHFNTNNLTCKQNHCQSRTSVKQAGHLDTLPLFLSQDVPPQECPLSGAQLDQPLSDPGCDQYRTRRSGCSVDGEAVDTTCLVHTQVVLLQQASCTFLADRPPGPGRTLISSKTHTHAPYLQMFPYCRF